MYYVTRVTYNDTVVGDVEIYKSSRSDQDVVSNCNSPDNYRVRIHANIVTYDWNSRRASKGISNQTSLADVEVLPIWAPGLITIVPKCKIRNPFPIVVLAGIWIRVLNIKQRSNTAQKNLARKDLALEVFLSR